MCRTCVFSSDLSLLDIVCARHCLGVFCARIFGVSDILCSGVFLDKLCVGHYFVGGLCVGSLVFRIFGVSDIWCFGYLVFRISYVRVFVFRIVCASDMISGICCPGILCLDSLCYGPFVCFFG